MIVTASGLISGELSQWLKEVMAKDDASAALDIHDMSLMYTELQWQLTLTSSKDLDAYARATIEDVLEVLTRSPAAVQWRIESWGTVARG